MLKYKRILLDINAYSMHSWLVILFKWESEVQFTANTKEYSKKYIQSSMCWKKTHISWPAQKYHPLGVDCVVCQYQHSKFSWNGNNSACKTPKLWFWSKCKENRFQWWFNHLFVFPYIRSFVLIKDKYLE